MLDQESGGLLCYIVIFAGRTSTICTHFSGLASTFTVDFFSLRLPPSRACTNEVWAQGSDHRVNPLLASYLMATDLVATDIQATDTVAIAPLLAALLATVTPVTLTNPAFVTNNHYRSDRSSNDWYLVDNDNISCSSHSPDDLFPAHSIAHHPGGYTDHKRNCGRIRLSNIASSAATLMKKSNSSSYIQRRAVEAELAQPRRSNHIRQRFHLPITKGHPISLKKVNEKVNHLFKQKGNLRSA